MDFDIRVAVESLANEKGLAVTEVKDAIQTALAMTTRQQATGNAVFDVEINAEMDDYKTFRVWYVVDPEDPETLTIPMIETRETEDEPERITEFDEDVHLTLADAKAKDEELTIGDKWREPWKSVKMGRREAQQAKQIINQKVRAAERKRIEEEYSDKVGMLLRGKVVRSGRDASVLDLGAGTEAVLPKRNLLPRENIRIESSVRAVLEKVDPNNRGPQLILNRTSEAMLERLLETEVPEIQDGTIRVVRLVRQPGVRAKVAVTTSNSRVDAVGACVGMRGSRIQSISNEIGGENVDVCLWDDDPVSLVHNAMRPAIIQDIFPDPRTNTMDIVVAEENIATALGREGVNVNLASRLAGWSLNLVTRQQLEQKLLEEVGTTTDKFMASLGFDEDQRPIAELLAENGFRTLDELSYATVEEYLEIDGFHEELATSIQMLAQEARIKELTTGESADGNALPDQSVIEFDGITEAMAYEIAAQGATTLNDIAELAAYELQELCPSLSEYAAQDLISRVRDYVWFAEGDDGADSEEVAN